MTDSFRMVEKSYLEENGSEKDCVSVKDGE